jgi:hypothetical protein
MHTKLVTGQDIPMDLVDDPVHDPLQEVPREVKSLGGHVIRRCHGAEDDDLPSVSQETIEQDRKKRPHT